MKPVKIDLSEPFDRVLMRVLSLPCGGASIANHDSADDDELKRAIRELYEAVNGRQVQTPIGWIAIAPPVAAFLKARPFYVESQIDLLIEAATRIISGPPDSNNGVSTFEIRVEHSAPGRPRQPTLNGTEDEPLRRAQQR